MQAGAATAPRAARRGAVPRTLAQLATSLTAALATCAPAARLPASPNPGWSADTVWVAADRDGDALVELDGDLLVVARRPLAGPLHVRCGGGRTWVVHAPLGHPGGPQALRPWTARGPGPALSVGEVLDLEVDARGAALVLERDPRGAVRLGRAQPDGASCDLGAPPGAVALALGARGPALALGTGGWAVAGCEGPWRVLGGLDGAEVLDLEPGPDGGWWTLERHRGEPEVLCVARSAEGLPRAAWPVGRSRRLARRAAGAWAWEPDERLLFAPRGGPCRLAQAGARAAVGDGRGGLVVAAAGALLRLTADGAAAPGQGGFARLVDVERVARDYSSPPSSLDAPGRRISYLRMRRHRVVRLTPSSRAASSRRRG